jgi:EAL domain-containing protein (putative c-di-GMP-specific phosphodiesterase class I)
VRNLDHEQNDLALCEAIIVMAKKLGIKVIAEGVETENQDRLLKEFGCDFGQGYLYSRPVPAPDFEILLDQWNQKDKPGSTKITA